MFTMSTSCVVYVLDLGTGTKHRTERMGKAGVQAIHEAEKCLFMRSTPNAQHHPIYVHEYYIMDSAIILVCINIV